MIITAHYDDDDENVMIITAHDDDDQVMIITTHTDRLG